MEVLSHTRSRGSISAFVICMVLASVAVTSMVFEGGMVASEYAELSDVTANAARLGAQSVSGIRAGDPEINIHAASATVKEMLRARGISCSVRVVDGYIVVTSRKDLDLKAIGLVGLRSRRIAVTRRAVIVGG